VKFVDPDGRQGIAGPSASYWMGNMSPDQMQEVGKQVLRYTTPAEDLWAVTTGKDFDGNDYSRTKAAGIAAIGLVPGFKGLKVLDKTSDFGKLVAKGFCLNSDGTYKAWAYRKNLQLLSGKLGKGYDAHHTFLKSRIDWFKSKGIDVNDPKNLLWRKSEIHSKTGEGAKKSAEHTRLWQDFIQNNPNATPEQIYKQRDIIEIKVFGNTKGDVPIK
jgi:hypothetical protein